MKVAIFYPWDINSIIERSNGAGVRVGFLIDFLKKHNLDVTVISLSNCSKKQKYGSIDCIQIRVPNSFAFFAINNFIKLLSYIFKMKSLHAMAYYNAHLSDSKTLQIIKSYIFENSIDAVILEYPFYYKYLVKAKIPYVMTNHDLIAISWTPGKIEQLLFRKHLLRIEKNAINSSFASIFVSEADAKYFENLLDNQYDVVSNPPKKFYKKHNKNVLYKYDLKDKNYALFVGSSWYPNINAVKLILSEFAIKLINITFVIVGDCGIKVKPKTNNVIITGRVSDSELEELYYHSKLVLIPLTHGTGSSIKTVEAMQLGKNILTTTIGVRGIDYSNYKSIKIEDNFKKYPELICNLMDQPTDRTKSNFQFKDNFYVYIDVLDKYAKKFNIKDSV